MAVILSGNPVVECMTQDMVKRIACLSRADIAPALALVRVGSRADDLSYERSIIKHAERLGILVKPYIFDEDVPQEELLAAIRSINNDRLLHGCLIFRPLSSSLDEKAVCNTLSAAKDIDGITTASLAAVFTDADNGYPPCTAQACIRMLDYYNIPLAGKHVVVIGRSLVVGKPLSMMLLRRNASVTVCHSKTENLEALCRSADVVICAAGRARAFGAQYFNTGQTVLDVGINFDANGVLCGDVDFDEVEPLVGAITPVFNAIGKITTLVAMEHVVKAAEIMVTNK